MAKKLESIVQLAVQTARQISANGGSYMAFLTTAAHNFKYSFRDQLLIFAQKPDATACAQIDFWNKRGRWVNRGATGIALLVDTDREATEMVERLTARMAREQGVTEALKASDQMKWVGLMNSIRASAEEVALTELVYA